MDGVGTLPKAPLPAERSAERVERILARFLGALTIAFGVEAAWYAVAQFSVTPTGISVAIDVLLFAALAGLTAAGLLCRLRATVVLARVVPVLYLVLLASWPVLVDPHHLVPGRMPWFWYLCSVALGAAAIGFRLRWSVPAVFVIPAVFVAVRSAPAGGGVSLGRAGIDAGYAFVLGAGVLLIVTMLRRVAAARDLAHATASAKYAAAVRAHEFEVERVQVDSILHDSVLTTFITAARAQSEAERRQAVAMATHALSEVTAVDALPGVSMLITIDALRGRFEEACRDLGIEVDVVTTGPTEHDLPPSVAETFIGAALQALTNSVQHAGPGRVRRWVVADFHDGGVAVEVCDDGVGFDMATMTPGRLGVRVSIVERMKNIGGRATIMSTPGGGTTVRLVWPDPSGVQHPGR